MERLMPNLAKLISQFIHITKLASEDYIYFIKTHLSKTTNISTYEPQIHLTIIPN